MADATSLGRRLSSLVGDIGRANVHALYPRDFEYYLVSLELVLQGDSGEETIDYFVFPVMPSSMTKSENNRVNIKKTSSANVIINSKHFVPHDLTIKGDFGRGFKLLMQPQGDDSISFRSLRFSNQSGSVKATDLDEEKQKVKRAEFSKSIKTGYGCIKILQSIIDKAKGVDDKGNPLKLYFYNPALGESYLVVPTPNALVLSQDDANNNMIWAYTLNLTIVAEVQGTRDTTIKSSLSDIVSVGAIQKAVNSLAKDGTNFLIGKRRV